MKRSIFIICFMLFVTLGCAMPIDMKESVDAQQMDEAADTDGDTTPDTDDLCPANPNKVKPEGPCGCGEGFIDIIGDASCSCVQDEEYICVWSNPVHDSDGDDVQDSMDECPYDPTKIKPGKCGCGISDSAPNCVYNPVTQDPPQDPAQDPAQDPPQDPSQDPSQDPPQDPDVEYCCSDTQIQCGNTAVRAYYKGIVTAKSMHIRVKPDYESRNVAYASRYDTFCIYGYADGPSADGDTIIWHAIYTPKARAYNMDGKAYLAATNTLIFPIKAKLSKDSELKSGMEEDSETVDWLSANAEVTVNDYDPDSNWFRVTVPGTDITGYLLATFKDKFMDNIKLLDGSYPDLLTCPNE